MTQKELLYVEDAIGHEDNIIKILEEDLSKLKDKKLIKFISDNLKIHNNMKKKLIGIMEVKSNG